MAELWYNTSTVEINNLCTHMNPKQFLVIGGIVLVLVGILGFVGVIGPTAADSIFGATWYFDDAENWAHTILGVVALVAAFAFPARAQKPLVIVVGLVGILFAVINLFTTKVGSANLEQHADTVLHAVVGIWALVAGFRGRSSVSSDMMNTNMPM
jgi:hypothetical protein